MRGQVALWLRVVTNLDERISMTSKLVNQFSGSFRPGILAKCAYTTYLKSIPDLEYTMTLVPKDLPYTQSGTRPPTRTSIIGAQPDERGPHRQEDECA